jgi:predicted N-acetyltransferase YhbS
MLPATIRVMTAADVGPAAELLRRGNWGQRDEFFKYAVEQTFARPFVAERDGAVVGTGIASGHGPVGWVGTIFVDESERRRGLGGALTEAALDALAAMGCRTLVLVATDAGRPVYERLGFEVRTHYQTFEIEGLARPGDDATTPTAGWTIRPFNASDLDEAAALDAVATGEVRRQVLATVAGLEGGMVLRDAAGQIHGFVARAPWGGGATVASSQKAALAMLCARRLRAGPTAIVRAGTPTDNEAGMAALEATGWRPGYRAPRMELGPRVSWRPDMLWGQFNMAIG